MASQTLISFDYAIKYLLKDKGDYEIVEGFISALLVSEGYNPVKIKVEKVQLLPFQKPEGKQEERLFS